MIVAIDGTTGSGKSTISKLLAQKLNFAYIRTGSFYRAIAYKILQNNISETNVKAIVALLKSTNINNVYDGKHVKVILDNTDVSSLINSPEISNFVSKISPIPEVREYVRKLQRQSAENCPNIIMEGRDIGSVVFPNADVKIYIDCNIDVRAKRRAEQYKQTGKKISVSQAKKDILARDYDDMHRKTSPLVRLSDAFYLDTSNFTIDECVIILENLVKNKQK